MGEPGRHACLAPSPQTLLWERGPGEKGQENPGAAAPLSWPLRAVSGGLWPGVWSLRSHEKSSNGRGPDLRGCLGLDFKILGHT